jgi:hypothetical protein
MEHNDTPQITEVSANIAERSGPTNLAWGNNVKDHVIAPYHVSGRYKDYDY